MASQAEVELNWMWDAEKVSDTVTSQAVAYRMTKVLGVLLNINNRDKRLGATKSLIIDIYFFFSIIIDMLWH